MLWGCEEPLECPFCGGNTYTEHFNGHFRVRCHQCLSCSDYFNTKEDAIREWNNRAATEIVRRAFSSPKNTNEKENYPEKQDSSKEQNAVAIPKNIGEKIIDAIIENKLFSVINPRTNKEIDETLVVWAGNANEIIKTVVCEQSCKKSYKEENVTSKPLVPKWADIGRGRYYLEVSIMQAVKMVFEIKYDTYDEPFLYTLKAFFKVWNSECDYEEECGVFNGLEEAKAKANELIKELGEKLVYYAENIKTKE